MGTIVMQHKIRGLYQEELLLSTVNLGGIYETALLDEDYEELEMLRTDNREEAIENHRKIARECEEKVKAKLQPYLIELFWTPGRNIEPYNMKQWERR